jgi:phosphoglycolate phosphatase-like HAD superfamily hydrolase
LAAKPGSESDGIVTNTLIREWDCFDAYLFDIDGTLLNCSDAVHYFAFCNTLTAIAGRPLTLDGVTAHGNTDVGILRDALALAGVDAAVWRPRLGTMQEEICRFVEERKQDVCVAVMPQVLTVLQRLSERGATLGVATGNLERVGKIKLERASLARYFQFGAWSDAFENRLDVIASGKATARSLAGENAAICVIGDTPADVRAARENGLSVIAVATGIYPFEELAAAGPDLCIHSFADLPGVA